MRVDTLRAGIDWSFETFPQYLDTVRALPKRINLGAFVPHSMVRLYVMGPDAAFSRTATDAELAEIRRLAREAMDTGAVGISTSQAPSHQGPQGRPVPSRFADVREVAALVETLAEVGRGIIEITYGPLMEIEEVAQLSRDPWRCPSPGARCFPDCSARPDRLWTCWSGAPRWAVSCGPRPVPGSSPPR